MKDGRRWKKMEELGWITKKGQEGNLQDAAIVNVLKINDVILLFNP